jgi:hypothetical protein
VDTSLQSHIQKDEDVLHDKSQGFRESAVGPLNRCSQVDRQARLTSTGGRHQEGTGVGLPDPLDLMGLLGEGWCKESPVACCICRAVGHCRKAS